MTEMVHRWRRFFFSLWTLFKEKNCQQNAAALTYMTLFAIVPLVTVSYAMLSLFPDFAGLETRLQAQIFDHFVPESGREVQEYISSFSSQAQRLTGAGIAILLVTAGLMLRNIEGTFNAIWDIPRGRSGVSSFLLYWATLSLGPILLGAGLAVSTYFFSQKFFVSDVDSFELVPMLLRGLPWALTAAAFTLLFIAVPNCRVPFRHGLAGGVVTACAFEVAKYLFGIFFAKSSVQAIYGAFAFVPLFLLWIYLMWMIVLAGCVLVRTLSAYHAATRAREYSDLMAALVLLKGCYANYERGQPLRDRDISRAGVKPAQWRRIREVLQKHNLITQTDRNDYVLARNLDGITLAQLMHWLSPSPLPKSGHGELNGQGWYGEFANRVSEAESLAEQQFSVSLGELFRTAIEETPPPADGGTDPESNSKKTRGKRGKEESASEDTAKAGLSVIGRRNKRM